MIQFCFTIVQDVALMDRDARIQKVLSEEIQLCFFFWLFFILFILLT